MQICDTLLIGDIRYEDISKETISFLESHGPIYKDQHLKEDIYNIEDIFDEVEESEVLPCVLAEIKQIQALMNEKEIAYIRVIEKDEALRRIKNTVVYPGILYVSKTTSKMYTLLQDQSAIDMKTTFEGIDLGKYKMVGENNIFNVYHLK